MSDSQVRYASNYTQLVQSEDDDSESDTELQSNAEIWTEASNTERVIFQPKHDSRAFQVSGSRHEVDLQDLSIIKKGDHVGWHRKYVIWHHAIVSDINTAKRELQVIHYTKHNGKVKVIEEWIKVDDQNGLMYKFDYPGEVTTVYHPDRVVDEARKYVGNENYKFLRNNCEHFATRCKTGKGQSHQVRWAVGKIIETAQTSGITILKDTAKFVLLKVASGAGKVVVGETVEVISKSTNIVGAIIVAGFEIGHCIYDIWQINKARKSGEMSSRDFKATVTQRVTESVCSGGLAIGGSLLGGFIGGVIGSAVPVIGTAAGTVVGSIIGGIAGSFLGKLVGPLIGRFFKSLWY